MLIRKTKLEDLDALMPLFQELWPDKTLDKKITKETLYQLLKSPDAEVFTLEHDNQIVGFMDIKFRRSIYYQGMVMLLEDIIISSSYRGRGFGVALVEHAEKLSREKRCTAIELSSAFRRKTTHTFWEKRGFKSSSYHFHKMLA